MGHSGSAVWNNNTDAVNGFFFKSLYPFLTNFSQWHLVELKNIFILFLLNCPFVCALHNMHAVFAYTTIFTADIQDPCEVKMLC